MNRSASTFRDRPSSVLPVSLSLLLALALLLGSLALVCHPTSSAVSPGPAPNPAAGPSQPQPTAPISPIPELVAGLRVQLLDYLPANPNTTGQVDYSGDVRRALLDAAGGELLLPSFPILVSRAAGQNWCLLVTQPTTISGTTGSVLLERSGAVQVLRAEGVTGLHLRHFAIEGSGGTGNGLGHGLLQVTDCQNVTIASLHVRASDADGIAVADCSDVRIVECTLQQVSKSALYVNGSQRVVLAHNLVMEFGGHLTPSNNAVGVGIQLSSCADLVCAQNIVVQGTGTGILCNANQGGAAPIGNQIEGNRIRGVHNPSNPDASSGIRLTNGATAHFTQTIVRGNSLRDCGRYGIFVEHHDGTLVMGNSIAESARSAIVVSSARDAILSENLLLNSGTSGMQGLFQIQLLNGASNALVRDNIMRHTVGARPASASDRATDASQGLGNELEPRHGVGAGPPTRGHWFRGDVVYHPSPSPGTHMGYTCITGGEPGVWRSFARVN